MGTGRGTSLYLYELVRYYATHLRLGGGPNGMGPANFGDQMEPGRWIWMVEWVIPVGTVTNNAGL